MLGDRRCAQSLRLFVTRQRLLALESITKGSRDEALLDRSERRSQPGWLGPRKRINEKVANEERLELREVTFTRQPDRVDLVRVLRSAASASIVARRGEKRVAVRVDENAHRLSSSVGTKGLALLPTRKPQDVPVEVEGTKSRFSRIGQLVEVQAVEVEASRELLPLLVDLRKRDLETRRPLRPKHHEALLPKPVDGEAQRGAIRTFESTSEESLDPPGRETLTTELDHTVVIGESLLHRAENASLQIEGLELRCDLRSHHEALRFPGSIAVADDDRLERSGSLADIRVLER